LDGFLANETHVSSESDEENVDMHAKYLQSLKSPSSRKAVGNFKIPQLPPMQSTSMIFSQVPYDDSFDDDYANDSFVVDVEEDNYTEEPDELEIAEMRLKEMRRKEKNKKNGIKRRKVVRRASSSSDEDEEMKELRNQLYKAE